MENGAPADGKDPSGFLSEIIGVPVTVKLNSGVVYKGELQSVDGYMNIALEKCEEYVNGQLRRSYGDAFVRGNNGKNSPRSHFSENETDRMSLQCSIFLQNDCVKSRQETPRNCRTALQNVALAGDVEEAAFRHYQEEESKLCNTIIAQAVLGGIGYGLSHTKPEAR